MTLVPWISSQLILDPQLIRNFHNSQGPGLSPGQPGVHPRGGDTVGTS